MTLPYLAAVLLAIATLHSALGSFLNPRAGKAWAWVFPQRSHRSIRVLVPAASVLLAIAFVVWFVGSAGSSARPASRFLIPEGYTGWVTIEFEVPGAAPLPVKNGENTLQIPPDGHLSTSSSERFGWARDSYYFYSATGSRRIADSGPQSFVWGEINGESVGVSGKRKYQEFFVGTAQQFKAQVEEKSARLQRK